MKALILSVLLFSSFSAHAQYVDCLGTAKDWIYKNTSAGSSQAAEDAMKFCSTGGRAACLDEAKAWIYKNTSAGNSEAGSQAIKFCSTGGDAACLQPTRDWIYKNTSAGNAEAAQKALETCRGQVRCEPSRGDRPAPFVKK